MSVKPGIKRLLLTYLTRGISQQSRTLLHPLIDCLSFTSQCLYLGCWTSMHKSVIEDRFFGNLDHSRVPSLSRVSFVDCFKIKEQLFSLRGNFGKQDVTDSRQFDRSSDFRQIYERFLICINPLGLEIISLTSDQLTLQPFLLKCDLECSPQSNLWIEKLQLLNLG